jgi:formyltetrahydrofolate-dependent phosphoribosylglycinamide formyltransferase
MTARIAVLASGGGSNLQALLDHFSALGSTRAGNVVLVASNKSDAGALLRAQQAGIDTHHICDPTDANTLLALFSSRCVDLIVLAGYLKLIPAAVTEHYRGRIVNVHPGPLPRFGGPGMYGHHVHAAVLRAGATHSGVTIHFVDDRYDHGAVIAHWPVPVFPGDTPDTLAARVLEVEHIAYPRAIDTLAAILTLRMSPS